MLHIPPSKPHLKWYEQSEYRRWIETLFAITSQRLNFTLHLGHGEHQAYVILKNRILFINAALPGLNHQSPQIIRFDPISEETRKNLIIKALTTHEAGHVLYTRLERKLSHKAQWIWNSIEDERIERLLKKEYPELGAAFTYINELSYFNQFAELDGSILEGILMWRFSKDSMRPWQPAPEQKELWKDIRPLVEAGWKAKNAEQVAFIAQMIEQILKEEGKNQSGATQPEQNPQQTQDTQPSSNKSQSDDSRGGGSNPQTPESSENPQDKEAEKANSTKQSDPESDPENAGQSSKEGQGQKQQQKSDPQGSAADSKSENSDSDEVPERLKSQVSASGSNAPEQSEEEKAAHLQQQSDSGAPGGGVSTKKLPEMNTNSTTQAQAPLQNIESYARQIAPLLKPHEEKSVPISHKSKGRFNYNRYSSGYEKYFDHKEIPHTPSPIFIDILLDQSSSMSGKRMKAAKEVAYLIARAALFAQSGYRITTFNHSYSELCTQKTGYEATREKITQLHAVGNTLLHPALEHILKNPPKDALHFIILICDGQLDRKDSDKCKNLIYDDRKNPKRILPLLIGEATNAKNEWENIFGAAQAFTEMDDMAKYIKSILTSYRQKAPKI